MTGDKDLHIRLPHLDGPTAFRLLGLLDALVAELWLLYGDDIARDAGFDDEIASPEDDSQAEFPF